MPPKKKGKGKKSGKKKSKSEPVPEVDLPAELTKEFYYVQIQELERRHKRYQAKYEALNSSNESFLEKYKDLTDDKKNRVVFYKRSLEQRSDEISDLRDRLAGLQQAKEDKREEFEHQQQVLRTEFQEMKDQLTSENNVLAARLASLEEFKIQKEALLAKFEELEKDLQRMREDHKTALSNIESKAVQDRDRLKKEMVQRVNHVAAEFRKVSNRQMAETTKRTIRENVSIQGQLVKMSDKVLELVQDTESMRANLRKALKRKRELEAAQSSTARRNASNMRVIHMLNKKIAQQSNLCEEYDAQEQHATDFEEDNERIQKLVESQREEIENCAMRNEELEDKVKRLREQLDAEQVASQTARNILSSAAATLTKILQSSDDVDDFLLRKLMIDVASADDLASYSSTGTAKILDAYSSVGDANTPAPDFRPHLKREASSAGGLSLAAASLIMSEWEGEEDDVESISTAKPVVTGVFSHCQPGALQLIPRPTDHIPSNQEKAARLANAAAARDHISVGIQTASAARALFLIKNIKK